MSQIDRLHETVRCALASMIMHDLPASFIAEFVLGHQLQDQWSQLRAEMHWHHADRMLAVEVLIQDAEMAAWHERDSADAMHDEATRDEDLTPIDLGPGISHGSPLTWEYREVLAVEPTLIVESPLGVELPGAVGSLAERWASLLPDPEVPCDFGPLPGLELGAEPASPTQYQVELKDYSTWADDLPF